jgi:flavin-binding protein dodecin
VLRLVAGEPWTILQPLPTQRDAISNNTYRMIENIGISPDRIDAAICNGLARAAETTRGLDWFEVQSVSGHLENRAIARLPITIKVGSSTVEAGCKAILAQRLKRSGMCWNIPAPRHPHPALPPGQRPLHYIWSQPHNQIATA